MTDKDKKIIVPFGYTILRPKDHPPFPYVLRYSKNSAYAPRSLMDRALDAIAKAFIAGLTWLALWGRE